MKPPLLSTRGKASSPVQSCPYANVGPTIQSADYRPPPPPLTPEERAKLVPCDLASVTLTLSDEGGSKSLTGSQYRASAMPLANVDPEINKLLKNYAVVIVRTVPATTVLKEVGADNGQLRTAELTKINTEATARADFSAQMQARCAKHPDFMRRPWTNPDADKKDQSLQSKQLVASTREWTVTEFLRSLWGGKPFRDFVGGGREEVEFTAVSCGMPPSGDPQAALSALARIELLDEWVGEFVFAKGFVIKMEAKEKTRTTKSGVESEVSIKERGSDERDDYDYEDKKKTGSPKADPGGTLSESTTKKFDKAAAALDDLNTKDGLSLSLTRNGQTVLDSSNWSKAVGEIKDTIEEILKFVRILTSGLREAAKAGFPVTVTYGLDLEVTLMQGQAGLRFWAEPQPAQESGTYYISTHRRRFQLTADIVPIKISLKPSIEAQGKFVHKFVGSATVTLEGKIEGIVKLGYSVSDGSQTEDFKVVSKIPMGLAIKIEIIIASFYGMADASTDSAITHVWTAGFDGEAMKFQSNAVTNDALSTQVTWKVGNKIWTLCGFGDDFYSDKWPEDGPFVWVKKDELKRRW